jgi:hypothetical protein
VRFGVRPTFPGAAAPVLTNSYKSYRYYLPVPVCFPLANSKNKKRNTPKNPLVISQVGWRYECKPKRKMSERVRRRDESEGMTNLGLGMTFSRCHESSTRGLRVHDWVSFQIWLSQGALVLEWRQGIWNWTEESSETFSSSEPSHDFALWFIRPVSLQFRLIQLEPFWGIGGLGISLHFGCRLPCGSWSPKRYGTAKEEPPSWYWTYCICL